MSSARRFALAILACAALSACSTRPETVNSQDWKFSAVFPCTTHVGKRSVPTAVGSVEMTSYTCDTAGSEYVVFVGDYPPGNRVDYDGAINGAASAVNGTIRTVLVSTFGSETGREAFLDIPSKNAVAHGRYFGVGPRLYQIWCIVPAGQERDKTCLDFLDSFKLLP
jgi:hypothetical protein